MNIEYGPVKCTNIFHGAHSSHWTQESTEAFCRVYWDMNYQGDSLYMEGGQEISWLNDYGSWPYRWNDEISSIEMGYGCSVTAWDDVNYRGESAVFNGNTGFVGNLNDRISSIKCNCVPR